MTSPIAVVATRSRAAAAAVVVAVGNLAFTAGYAPRDGPEVVHVRATSEAVRLADLAADLMTDSPVLAALSALLTLHDARRDARTGADGALVRLADQDRTRWNHSQIRAGLARLTALTPTTGYAEELRLQALIAAFHASAATSADTDWVAIARTYARLEALAAQLLAPRSCGSTGPWRSPRSPVRWRGWTCCAPPPTSCLGTTASLRSGPSCCDARAIGRGRGRHTTRP